MSSVSQPIENESYEKVSSKLQQRAEQALLIISDANRKEM